MMKLICFCLLITISACIISSCSGCSKEKNPQKIDSVSTTINIPQKDTARISDKAILPGRVESGVVREKSKHLIPVRELQKYLPDAIKGFEKIPWSGGSSSDDNNIWNTVSTEYVHRPRGFVSVAIYDYGENGYISEAREFDSPPEESGMITEKLVLGNGKGYRVWDKEMRRGSAYALIKNRYVIRINAESLPQSSGDIQDIFKLVKTDKLIARGNSLLK